MTIGKNVLCLDIRDEMEVLRMVENGYMDAAIELVQDAVKIMFIENTNLIVPAEIVVGQVTEDEGQIDPLISILDKIEQESISRNVKLTLSERMRINPLNGILYLDIDDNTNLLVENAVMPPVGLNGDGNKDVYKIKH